MKNKNNFQLISEEAKSSLKELYIIAKTTANNDEKLKKVNACYKNSLLGFDLLLCSIFDDTIDEAKASLRCLYCIAEETVNTDEELAMLCNYYLKINKYFDLVEKRTKQ